MCVCVCVCVFVCVLVCVCCLFRFFLVLRRSKGLYAVLSPPHSDTYANTNTDVYGQPLCELGKHVLGIPNKQTKITKINTLIQYTLPLYLTFSFCPAFYVYQCVYYAHTRGPWL